MQRFVRIFTLLVSVLLLVGLIAAACGDGDEQEAEPTATTAAEAPETAAEQTFISGQVEGDFVAPDSHSFTSTFEFAGISGSQEVVIIGNDAWTREGAGDWTKTTADDPEVQDATDLTSADPEFLFSEDLAEGIAVLESEPETIDGVETRRYHIPMEAVEAIVGLLGEEFLEDAGGLEEFEMTVWLEEQSGALVRAELNATAGPEIFGGDAGFDLSPDASAIISMTINLTQINDPDIRIEPPIGETAEAEPGAGPDGASPFDSFHYTVDLEFTISQPGEE